MKRLFFLLMGVVFANLIFAQKSAAKLYGYEQAVIPGIAAADKRIYDDAGNAVERRPEDTRMNYFFYLATSSTAKVYPVEIWVKGKVFAAQAKEEKAPIEMASHLAPGRPQKITLVPKTTQKLTRLEPAPFTATKTNTKAAQLAKEAELVIVYKQGGKTSIQTLKTLEKLPPKALQ